MAPSRGQDADARGRVTQEQCWEAASVLGGSTRKLQTTAPRGKASIGISLFGKLRPFCAQGKCERSVVLTPR